MFILQQQPIHITVQNVETNGWWSYLSPIIAALGGYLGGLLTPWSLSRLKVRNIRRKLNVFPDLRHNGYFGIGVLNGSQYAMHRASASLWLGYSSDEIEERMMDKHIGWTNKRQIAGDKLPWGLNPSTPIGIENDLNPGETQYVLLAYEFGKTSMTIASEYGINGSYNNTKVSVSLGTRQCNGIIKIVSEDSVPAFYHVHLDFNAGHKMKVHPISERKAQEVMQSFENRWLHSTKKESAS